MKRVNSLSLVILKNYAGWTALLILGAIGLTAFVCFLRWDLQALSKWSWTDLRIILILAALANFFYLRDEGTKGGKQVWDQATADKLAKEQT